MSFLELVTNGESDNFSSVAVQGRFALKIGISVSGHVGGGHGFFRHALSRLSVSHIQCELSNLNF